MLSEEEIIKLEQRLVIGFEKIPDKCPKCGVICENPTHQGRYIDEYYETYKCSKCGTEWDVFYKPLRLFVRR